MAASAELAKLHHTQAVSFREHPSSSEPPLEASIGSSATFSSGWGSCVRPGSAWQQRDAQGTASGSQPPHCPCHGTAPPRGPWCRKDPPRVRRPPGHVPTGKSGQGLQGQMRLRPRASLLYMSGAEATVEQDSHRD